MNAGRWMSSPELIKAHREHRPNSRQALCGLRMRSSAVEWRGGPMLARACRACRDIETKMLPKQSGRVS